MKQRRSIFVNERRRLTELRVTCAKSWVWDWPPGLTEPAQLLKLSKYGSAVLDSSFPTFFCIYMPEP
jgi:hypothetical protein